MRHKVNLLITLTGLLFAYSSYAVSESTRTPSPLSPSLSETTQQGYYFGMLGGLAFPTKFKDALRNGFSISSHYGYRDDNYRTEIELNYIQNTVKTTSNPTYSLANLMLNAYFDFNYSGILVPFIGGGFGYLYAWRNSCNLQTNCTILQTGSKFAYQGIVGIGFNIKHKVRLDLRYRYLILDHSQNFSQNLAEVVLNYFFK